MICLSWITGHIFVWILWCVHYAGFHCGRLVCWNDKQIDNFTSDTASHQMGVHLPPPLNILNAWMGELGQWFPNSVLGDPVYAGFCSNHNFNPRILTRCCFFFFFTYVLLMFKGIICPLKTTLCQTWPGIIKLPCVILCCLCYIASNCIKRQLIFNWSN